MPQSTKTISAFVLGALFIALTFTSAAHAQQGSFQGQYSGAGDATGAVLTLAQRGPDVTGELYVDGTAYMVRAKVSGTKGYGALGDPTSDTIMEFGILAHAGDVYVLFPKSADSPKRVFQFQRGAGAATKSAATADRRARRRERVKRAFAGMALIGVAAAVSANNATSGSSSGGSSGGVEVIYPDNDPNPTNDPYQPGGDSYEP
jgi:hypothetical protein